MTSHLQSRTARNEPIWLDSSDLQTFEELRTDVRTDVCIVGAGIAGLTTAYQLTREGKRVVVLDDGPVAGGMTSVTTAHLVTALDDRFFELESFHGHAGARLAAESHAAAIDLIESIVRGESIACDFERLDGFLFQPPGGSRELLERELAAAQRAGVRGVHAVDRAPIPRFDTGPALLFPRQAQFHPVKYLSVLARAVRRAGGEIYTNTHATRIAGGREAHVETNGQVVMASALVVATNTPVNDLLVMHTKQAPYMTYVIVARIPAHSVPRALFWDTSNPYHYVRLADTGDGSGEEYLVVGGEDHKTGQLPEGAEPHAQLEQWARERFPRMGEVEFTWAGQVMEPVDGLAFIGRNPADYDNVFIATGDSGNVMTHGTIAGILLTDLIMGRENAWRPLYDPARKTVEAAGTFARETINMLAQYAELVTRGDVESVDDIAPETGAVLRRGVHKLAVYRDGHGRLHQRSAVCPHLGCIVAWNPAEKTWDCPCHGSRFDKTGTVVSGPANRDLAEAPETA